MLEKKKSKIDGLGIFTDQLIRKGEEFYRIPTDVTSDRPKPKWARIGDKYICDRQVLNFINHSCEPNAFIGTESMCLVASIDINPGEEITVCYEKTEIDGVKTPCTCGSDQCKGYFLKEV